MLRFYLKSAIRGIQRQKIASLLNVAGLTFGITIFLLVLEYYSYETAFNGFHQNSDRLFRLNRSSANGKSPETSPALGPDLERSVPGIHASIRFCDNFNDGAIVSHPVKDGPPLSLAAEKCVFVDKSFLDAFSFPLLQGSNQLDHAQSVVLTRTTATKMYGQTDPIGQTLVLHNQFGQLICTVAGIVMDPPSQSDIQFDCLFSMEALNNPSYIAGSEWASPQSWGNDSYTTYLWLDPQADPLQIAKTASRIWAKDDPDYKKEDGNLLLQPIGQLHLGASLGDNNPTAGNRFMVYLIFSLGILVLCIAWVNMINFSTALALSQAKNIGIQKIIGCDKRHIIWRYLMESLLLNLIGLGLAFLLADTAQGLFNYLTDQPLSLKFLNQPGSWLIGLGAMVTGVALCGGYIGWILAGFRPASALRFNTQGQLGHALLRKGLVVFQFAVASLLIMATITVYRQIEFMQDQKLGMNLDHLVVIDGPQFRDSTTHLESQAFLNDLRALPWVSHVSHTGSIPGPDFAHNYSSDNIVSSLSIKGDEKQEYYISEVDEQYFPLFQIPFASGRNFNDQEVSLGYQARKWIINQAAAEQLHLSAENALHQKIRWQGKDWEIIGVTMDYHHRSLKESIEPIIFIPSNNINKITASILPGQFNQKSDRLNQLYKTHFPGDIFNLRILKESYNTQYREEQRTATLALCVALCVILIACLGLVGLSIFTARRRTKEIGIRKVLGASIVSIFGLLSRELLGLVLLAWLLSAPLGWLTMRSWLQNFAFHVQIGPWSLVGAGMAVLFIAGFTVSFQALTSALMNPTHAIRTES
jgi:putative ABC transport system permease protein